MWKVPARGRVVLSATRFGNFNLNRLLFNQCPPVEPHLEAQVAGLRRLRLPFLLAAVAAILFGVVVSHGSAPGTFDGAPSAPLSYSSGSFLDGWDVQVHSRDPDSWFALPAIDAQHGGDCSAPPATHPNTSYEGSVFQCKDHIMTAINGAEGVAGYAEIVLTPGLLLDFSQGGSVTWEMSTQRMSVRDWWDVTISPFDQSLAVPLLSDLSQGVDLNGTAMNAIHVGTDNGEGAPMLKLVSNGNVVCMNSPCAGWALWPANANIPASVNQAASRQPFKLTIANGRIRFERLASATAPALLFWDIAATPSFTQGVVQFGHHSYSPEKDSAGVPATRHWDNINASPSTPFTIARALDRYTQGGTIQFATPAPAGAVLRFAAVCAVTVNGQGVSRVPSALYGENYHPEHKSSYSIPIPEGATSAQIGLTDNYGGPCIAEGFTLWSQGASGPTATPTNTATPAPPTNTPTQTSTAVPPTATPTRTLTPLPYRCVNSLGQTKPGWVPGGRC